MCWASLGPAPRSDSTRASATSATPRPRLPTWLRASQQFDLFGWPKRSKTSLGARFCRKRAPRLVLAALRPLSTAASPASPLGARRRRRERDRWRWWPLAPDAAVPLPTPTIFLGQHATMTPRPQTARIRGPPVQGQFLHHAARSGVAVATPRNGATNARCLSLWPSFPARTTRPSLVACWGAVRYTPWVGEGVFFNYLGGPPSVR